MASFKPGDRVTVMETKKYTAEVVGPVIPHTGLIMIKTAPDGVTFLVRKDTLRKLKPRATRLRGWVRLWPDGSGSFFKTKEQAGSEPSLDSIRFFRVVEVRRKRKLGRCA